MLCAVLLLVLRCFGWCYVVAVVATKVVFGVATLLLSRLLLPSLFLFSNPLSNFMFSRFFTDNDFSLLEKKSPDPVLIIIINK